jgi:hypothetical protein
MGGGQSINVMVGLTKYYYGEQIKEDDMDGGM